MTDRRQLTDPEKEAVIARCGMRCFINDHPIESDADLEFDYIHGVRKGEGTVDNMAPVCMRHKRRKGNLSLFEYRDCLDSLHDACERKELVAPDMIGVSLAVGALAAGLVVIEGVSVAGVRTWLNWSVWLSGVSSVFLLILYMTDYVHTRFEFYWSKGYQAAVFFTILAYGIVVVSLGCLLTAVAQLIS